MTMIVSKVSCILSYIKGTFNNYVDKMKEGGGGQKMSVFVHAQGIKNCPCRGGGGLKNGEILST